MTPLMAAELFAVSNLAFLALDVFVAHSVNRFADPGEWIPVLFSAIAPLVLLIGMGLTRSITPPAAAQAGRQRWVRVMGLSVGVVSVLVGIAGLLWHLSSQFFAEATLKNLVYTAPFVAPLAYTGIGLVILLNRLRSDLAPEDWGRWIVLLAAWGFLGNFVLSLADHAQNGFFDVREWIPVAAAALAVGNLSAVLFIDRSRTALQAAAGVMFVQVGVGLAGWYYHFRAIVGSEMSQWWDRVVYGAPIFAPLLFADLAGLALIGLWSLVPVRSIAEGTGRS